jgi:hypothetical protein
MEMKKVIISLGLVGMLLGALFVGMIGFVPPSQGASADWMERIIANPSENVNSIAIGDADNDGNNDVVIGMSDTTNELRIYTKVEDTWIEEAIDSFSASVLAVTIGDADNDGFNEIIAGLTPGPAELYIYEKDDGVWGSNIIANLGLSINSVAIGDVDNDGKNEVVTGEETASNGVQIYEGGGSSWNNEYTIDPPAQVNSIAIGDADNDMNNEIVMGLNIAAPDFHVRAYENVSGVWEVDNISTTPTDVLSVAIGDADNDGTNDVVCGLASTTNEIRVYKESGGSWSMPPGFVPDVPTDVNSVMVGDVDNDAKNEILIGMASATNEVRAYEYDIGGSWIEEIIADTPNDVLSVAIGDADGETNMDAVIGMASTTNEVRLYSLDRGELVFTSHNDGDYVSGNERFDVFVTSNYVESVKFYLDDVVIFQDISDPYQFVLDTTQLVDDTTYTVKAEGLRHNAPSLIDTVDVVVKNSAIVGGYISVSTMRFNYTPDQDVAVIISTISPPAYDYVNLVVGYTDPSGNEMFAMADSLPVATQYMVILPLSSDSELGQYDVTADAYGFSGDFLIWEATDTATFNVSGKNLKDLLDDLNAQHVVLNDTIDTLSGVVADEHAFSRSEILSRINDTIDALQGFDQSVIDHDVDMKGILDALNDLVINESNLSKTEILSGLGIIVNEVEDLDSDLTTEAGLIKGKIDTETTEIDTNLATHDDNLDSAEADLKEANDKLATNQTITILLMIIALVFLLISLMLVNKGYKMMKDAKGKSRELPPEKEYPVEDTIEHDDEIEGAIDDALGDIESVESEEL